MVIIDNGHGGIINGVYQTAGKRSPENMGKPQIFEGDENRKIANKLAIILSVNKIPHHILVPESQDISLSERVKRANTIYKTNKSAFLLSIHLNAGGGTGFEAFTTKGETKSDKYANYFYLEMSKMFPDKKMRKDITDGDDDKEADFYILRKTNCPAVLVECFFMDNKDDFELLHKPETLDKIAVALYNAIRKCLDI